MKDQEIIELFWNREETAIAASAEKYGSYCFSISYNILHSKEDAEECVNDTWLGAWRAIPPHRPEYLQSFLGKIVRNLSLDCFRKYNAQKRGLGQTELVLSELEACIPGGENVEQIIDEQVLVRSINDFLYGQPPLKRNIFIRRYWYLSSIKDIAGCYGISQSKVTSILFRMRSSLKTHLEKEGIAL